MKFQDTFSFKGISINDVGGACDCESGGCGDGPTACRPAAEIVDSALAAPRRSSLLSEGVAVADASFGIAFAANSERADAGGAARAAEWGCGEIVYLKQCR